jgi:hypothetical protein
MAALNVSAVVLASRDSIGQFGASSPSQLSIGISISDSGGAPVAGLAESQVQIAFADGDRVQTPPFFFSQEVQDTDENGDPKFDGDGNPIMIRVQGPARSLGLPGFYLIILTAPDGGWMTTPFTVEVAIRMNGDCGQTFASFTEEALDFRIVAGGNVRDSFEILLKLLSAYSDTGRGTLELTGFSALALANQVSSLSDKVVTMARFLKVPGI